MHVRHLMHNAYADDVFQVALSAGDSKKALECVDVVSARWGLTVNWSKTDNMLVQPPTVPSRLGAPSATTLASGRECAFVDSTKHLGQRYNASADISEELRRRVSAASFAFFRHKSVLLDRRGRSIRTRGVIYKTYVMPHLLFGGPETWALTQAQLQGLSAVHNGLLRRIANTRLGPGGLSNGDLFRITGVPELKAQLDQLRLRRLGHIARMPDSALVKQLMFAKGLSDGSGEGRVLTQVVGRPRPQWFQHCMESLSELDLQNEWYTLSQDRRAWRELCGRILG